MAFIDVIADGIIGHTINLMRYDAKMRRRILAILLDLQDELIGKLSNSDLFITRKESLKVKRLRQLLDDTTESISTYYAQAKAAHVEGLLGVVQVEVDFHVDSINSLAAADIVSASMSAANMRSLVNQSLIEGAPASEWWGRQSQKLRRSFADQMRIAVATSESMNDTLQRIRGRHTGRYVTVETAAGETKKVPEFAGGIMQASTREASALIRTSVQSVANDARLEVYAQNDDMVKGVQALVTLDNRTSAICRARSGHAWRLDGTPIAPTKEDFPGPPPWHFNCRSTLVPILKSWDELAGPNSKLSKAQVKKLRRMPKGTQSSMDGQVAADLTYEEWLKTKSVEFQKDVLGPGRWELWQKGRLTLEQMVDQTGRELSLAELRARSRR